MTFKSRWSCDIQFHKYVIHINGDFWRLAPPTNFVGRHYRKFPFKCNFGLIPLILIIANKSIDIICTLLANIKFICTSFRNRKVSLFWPGIDFTKSRKSKISHKCEFQPIKSLEITLTINLRLTTFCEIDPFRSKCK